MNEALLQTTQEAAPETKLPWDIFLFLTALFLIAQHDWFFSLTGADSFGTTVDEFTSLVDQGSIVRRIAFSCLGIFAAARLLLTRSRGFTVNVALGRLILLFLSWAFLSLSWSEHSLLASKRLALLGILWFSGIVFSQRLSPREILLWVFFSTLVYLHIGLLAEITLGTFHPAAGEYRFAGTIHPNSQGVNCALLFITSLFMITTDRRWRRFALATAGESLVFLFLTKSRASLGFALIAPLIYWSLTLPSSRKVFICSCFGTLSSLLLLTAANLLPALHHVVSLGRKDSDSLTLTGRIPLWEQLVTFISKRPVQGYGFDSFWTSNHVADVASEQGWAVTQAHSSYIDLCLGLGLVGVTVYVIILTLAVRLTFRYVGTPSGDGHAFSGVIIIFVMLNGLLESIFIYPDHVSFVSILILTSLGFSSFKVKL
jgi:O-antigen ligase